jgi:hypothetical protein
MKDHLMKDYAKSSLLYQLPENSLLELECKWGNNIPTHIVIFMIDYQSQDIPIVSN